MGTQSGKSKTKDVATRHPVVTGIELEDKHEGRQINLVAQQGSLMPRRLKGTID